MSRTIRRKTNAQSCYGWDDRTYRFHTDMHCFMNISRKCRQPLNRSLRAKNNHIMRSGKSRGYGGLVFIPHKRNADWMCW